MTRIVFTAMVTFLGFTAAPALAGDTTSTPAATMSADLPMTPAFAEALGRYRDCVLASVAHGGVGSPAGMARAAMVRCRGDAAMAHGQLLADVLGANPGQSVQRAADQAAAGMAMVNPMIEDSATERAQTEIVKRTQ